MEEMQTEHCVNNSIF